MFEKEQLEIVYQDEYMVAINKPPGLLVHRTKLAKDASQFALQLLRDQLNRFVQPVHRLDRKTSGVLLFGFDTETVKTLSHAFANQTVKKRYLAIVRGFFPDEKILNYDLTNVDGKKQNAITHFKLLEKAEINVPFGKFETSRYSLIEAYPKTGRMHQIRKHCAHLFHPIIGDRPHGCNKQNRLFKERWKMTDMLLHAQQLSVPHPITGEIVHLTAQPSKPFKDMYQILFQS